MFRYHLHLLGVNVLRGRTDSLFRGNWLILMHDDDEEAFMQIAFDDHPDGIDLEYREGADKPLYHCKRPVLRLEAENAPTTATVTAASYASLAAAVVQSTSRGYLKT